MKIKIWVTSMILFLGLVACDPSGTNNSYDESMDDLFLGLKFGMTRQAFFDTSFAYNARKIIVNGGNEYSVAYKTRGDELNYDGFMYYYPKFTDSLISEVPMKFHYSQWAPWNKYLWADSLIIDVKELMETWFGPGFKESQDKLGNQRFLKIDGPRSIAIQKVDDQYVKVNIKNEKYSN
ncbi:MAG: hypothetical protein HKN68_02155 [Saprospiraceae bacterium]|nr:hypothetical protein [Saprospiraceae bacterium]